MNREERELLDWATGWLLIAVALLVLLFTGCAARRNLRVPGCSLSAVHIPDGCYPREFPDRLEVHCKQGITTYRCEGGSKK